MTNPQIALSLTSRVGGKYVECVKSTCIQGKIKKTEVLPLSSSFKIEKKKVYKLE